MGTFFKRLFLQVLPILVFLHAGLLLAFWLTNSLFYADTNNFLANLLHARLDYIRIVLLISGGLLFWSLARLALLRFGRPVHRFTVATSVLYGFCSIVYIAFFYGSFQMLFHESAIQITRINQILRYHRVILDPVIFLVLALLVGMGLRNIRRSFASRLKRSLVLPTILLFACLWVLMLFLPPSSVYHGAIPAKPKIIAHRGASFLAPENTMAAAELAVQLGAYGLETDIHISQDNVPYLMHDDTLDRTTNVAEIFPGREKNLAETFTWPELQRLNAGEWFVARDPYQTIASGKVTPDQIATYRGLGVPTLTDELEVIKRSGLVFIFDLKQKPASQSYPQDYFNLVLNQIHSAGIDDQIWFLSDDSQRPIIRSTAPAMKLCAGIEGKKPPAAETLAAAGYQEVNSEYSLPPDYIQAYRQAGLWVNIWTVDESWMFSRLWLLGVNSITSSNVGEMAALKSPVLALPYPFYLGMWLVVGAAGLLLVIGLASWKISPRKPEQVKQG